MENQNSDDLISEEEYLEACVYRQYVLSSYGLKPIYPQWFDAAKYTKCLDIIMRYNKQCK